MSNSSSSQGDVFEVRKIRRLVELMKEHDLSEIDLRQSDQRIRIRRGSEPIVTTGPAAGMGVGSAAPPAQPAAAPAAAAAETAYTLINSPMVGTFYTAPNPESPAFVRVGDQVHPDTTVCIIEAMKVFNEIPAECTGKIAAVLVENGDPVEYGQPLFKVDPSK